MEIEYQQTPGDLRALERYCQQQVGGGIGWRFILIYVVPLALMTFMYLVNQHVDWVTRVGVAVGFVFLLVVFYRRRQGFTVVNEAAVASDRHRLAIGPEGVRHACRTGEALTRWLAVAKVGVTTEHVFLFIGPGNAYVVPRRAFADASAFENFVHLAWYYLTADLAAHFTDRPPSPEETYYAAAQRWNDRRTARL